MNNIFISTGGFDEPAYKAVKKLIKEGINNIELSGGEYHGLNLTEVLKLKKNFRIHNYFPPPKIPFVLNVASANDSILNKTMKHIFASINLAKKIKSKYYSFHAGFLLDPDVKMLGKKFSQILLQNRIDCLNNFKKNVFKISNYAKLNNIEILIENNVVTKKNYELFGQNPFLLSNPKEISEFFLKAPTNVGLLMDVGHLKVSSKTENFSKEKALIQLNKFVKCYHLSENDSRTDSNKPFNSSSWFLKNLKKDLDYYTIEVYTKSIKTLKKQLSIIKNYI